jgi:hypothetical protein
MVATKVVAMVNGQQYPWINLSIKGDFFFREGKAEYSASKIKETLYWQSIEGISHAVGFRDYLVRFSDSIFADIVKRHFVELEKNNASVPPLGFTLEALD